jgi:hypothetical protein
MTFRLVDALTTTLPCAPCYGRNCINLLKENVNVSKYCMNKTFSFNYFGILSYRYPMDNKSFCRKCHLYIRLYTFMCYKNTMKTFGMCWHWQEMQPIEWNCQFFAIICEQLRNYCEYFEWWYTNSFLRTPSCHVGVQLALEPFVSITVWW